MRDTMTHALFAGCLGSTFRVRPAAGQAVEVKLIEATLLPVHPGRDGARPRREPFSLIFRGPVQWFLPQRTYPVEHDTLGRFDLFIVPVGPDPEGMRYQAVFN